MQSIDTDAQFVYNENGLRVKKTVNGVVTDHTLHGKNVVHMKRGDDELHFFYDAQNRPAVVVYNNVPYAYVKSLQGDVIAILDAAGNVVVSYVYDAWGAPMTKRRDCIISEVDITTLTWADLLMRIECLMPTLA